MARRLLALTTGLFALSAPPSSAATICVPFQRGLFRDRDGYALDIQSPGSTVSNPRVVIEPQVGGFERGVALSAAGVTASARDARR